MTLSADSSLPRSAVAVGAAAAAAADPTIPEEDTKNCRDHHHCQSEAGEALRKRKTINDSRIKKTADDSYCRRRWRTRGRIRRQFRAHGFSAKNLTTAGALIIYFVSLSLNVPPISGAAAATAAAASTVNHNEGSKNEEPLTERHGKGEERDAHSLPATGHLILGIFILEILYCCY